MNDQNEFQVGFVVNLPKGKIDAVRFTQVIDGSAFVILNNNFSWPVFYAIGKKLFLTEDDARIAAEAARKKKIASLKKQIEKLERMSFTVGERHE